MRKIHKLFLIATIALGLGFVACNDANEVSQVDESKANTHVSVTLKLGTSASKPISASASTRAGLPNDYNYIEEWAGEDVIDNITVYLVDGSSVTSKAFSVGDGQDYEIVNDLLVPTKEVTAIKTTAGTKKVYVLINAVGEVTAHLNKTPVAEFEDAYQKVALELNNEGSLTVATSTSASKLAVKNTADERIVMTNVEPKTLTVEPGITAEQTLGAAAGSGSNPHPLNRVSLEVERTVARVMVTISKDTYNIPDPNTNGATSLGAISNITYVAAQGENSLFVQRKSDWATPNYTWISTNANYNTEAADKYDYSGLFEGYVAAPGFGGTAIPTMAAYNKPPTIGELTPELESLKGKYILPTTHAVGVKDASNYKKGNTAYVLVRAQFTPSATAFADGGTYTAGEDFFVGGNGKFYISAANALTPAQGGVLGQTVARYVGGKVLYYAWVNPDEIPAWYNSPVLRNNIYHIHITGFKNLGTNWNPLFPEDPSTSEPLIPNPEYDPNEPEGPDNPKKIPNPEYNPKNPDPKPQIPTVEVPDPDNPGETIPVDPEEPVNPIDPEDPLTTPETWMSVDVKVLPWKVHSYDVELGM